MQAQNQQPVSYYHNNGPKLWLMLFGFVLFLTGLFAVFYGLAALILLPFKAMNLCLLALASLAMYGGRAILRKCRQGANLCEF